MEQAMDSLSDKFSFRVRWEPFLLRSNIPYEGLPYPASYKDPNNPRVQTVRNAAAAVGLDFSLKRERFPSTVRAHALLEYAKEVDDGEKQDAISEKLFKKYFTDADLLGLDTLVSVAEECGLDKTQVKAYLSNSDNIQKALDRATSWSARGLSGVPTFYMNGQKVFSGAQEPETFKRMFEIAAERFPLSKS